jgi:hypothetical protein
MKVHETLLLRFISIIVSLSHLSIYLTDKSFSRFTKHLNSNNHCNIYLEIRVLEVRAEAMTHLGLCRHWISE